jgi:hypothetical protein
MKSTWNCDYTRPGVDPWWDCTPAGHADQSSAANQE